MNRLLSKLNPAQLHVLTWVGEGCPAGVMEGHTHKTTALALQNRRLVTISRRGGVWRAAITDAGRYYLEHGKDPGGEGGGGTPVGPRMPHLPSEPRSQGVRGAGKKAKAAPGPKPPSPTNRLIAALVANGGRLAIDPADQTKYRSYVAAAARFGKVPQGKQMSLEWDGDAREHLVVLRDEPEWVRAVLEPIPVPATLRRVHPAVEYLRANDRLSVLERPSRQRGLRLLQGLAAEAERRGYAVEPLRLLPNRIYLVAEGREHLRITRRGHSSTVELRQEVNRTRHEPTRDEQARAERDHWYSIPKYDVAPSDRLSLWLAGGREHRQSKWVDSGSARLEELLPQVLQEIELRAAAVERERLVAIAAAEQRRLRWEAAMDDARRDYAEAYRAQVLLRQAKDWLLARELRGYLDAMDRAITNISDEEAVAQAREWQDWAEQWMKAADPLAGCLSMPVVPEPTAEDLKAHLGGWSPYGPDPTWHQ